MNSNDMIIKRRRLLIIEAESRTTKIYPLSLFGLGDCILKGVIYMTS